MNRVWCEVSVRNYPPTPTRNARETAKQTKQNRKQASQQKKKEPNLHGDNGLHVLDLGSIIQGSDVGSSLMHHRRRPTNNARHKQPRKEEKNTGAPTRANPGTRTTALGREFSSPSIVTAPAAWPCCRISMIVSSTPNGLLDAHRGPVLPPAVCRMHQSMQAHTHTHTCTCGATQCEVNTKKA